jgi:hypothetical protein
MKNNDDIVDTIYACYEGFDSKNVVKVGKHKYIKLKLAVQAADEIVRLRDSVRGVSTDLDFLMTDLKIILGSLDNEDADAASEVSPFG